MTYVILLYRLVWIFNLTTWLRHSMHVEAFANFLLHSNYTIFMLKRWPHFLHQICLFYISFWVFRLTNDFLSMNIINFLSSNTWIKCFIANTKINYSFFYVVILFCFYQLVKVKINWMQYILSFLLKHAIHCCTWYICN